MLQHIPPLNAACPTPHLAEGWVFVRIPGGDRGPFYELRGQSKDKRPISAVVDKARSSGSPCHLPCTLSLSQVKNKNSSPKYMEQAPSRGHEASSQSGLDVGYKLRSSSSEPRGLSVRAQVHV